MTEQTKRLIGSFKQIVTLNHLPLKGAVSDEQLEVINNGGVVVEGNKIVKVGDFDILYQEAKQNNWTIDKTEGEFVLMPAFVDCHTHICFAGSRANDYALRTAGKSYLEIAKSGGGIIDSVRKTRAANQEELTRNIIKRCQRMLSEGVTTCEVKSGYGLSVDEELKMLKAIQEAQKSTSVELIATCLAAHICPPEFENAQAYVNYIVSELFPKIKAQNLANRVDVFVEDTAFDFQVAKDYLTKAKAMGFDCTIHADQFSTNGSRLAVEVGAVSADHLEATKEEEVKLLANSDVIAVVLPGASLGLGMHYAPARKLLDAGCSLAISTDWNPGSAPMGDLLMQAALLGAAEKLTTAETFAGITFRAAKALGLEDRGIIAENKLADMIAFDCADYREILYQQGKLKPAIVWKKGQKV